MHFIEQLKQDLSIAIAARADGLHLVFGYLGAPGTGKTQGIQQVVKELGYDLWSGFNISAASPMDVAIKMPNMEEGVFETLPSDDFPWKHIVGDKKVVLFIDEITNGTSDTIKAIQRLVNERRLGKFELGENVLVILAGNRQSDKAGSGSLSTAMYNRVTWRNLVWTAKDSDVALDYLTEKYKTEEKKGVEMLAMLQGYFAHKPILEKDFSDALGKIGKEPFIQWCSPRSLEALLCRVAHNDWNLPEIADMGGDVGMGRATELFGFNALLGKVEKYEKVVADPDKAKMPDSVEAQYAMLSMLAVRVKKAEFDAIWKYVARMKEVTMRVVFLKMALKASPEVREAKSYADLYKTDKELVSAIGSV